MYNLMFNSSFGASFIKTKDLPAAGTDPANCGLSATCWVSIVMQCDKTRNYVVILQKLELAFSPEIGDASIGSLLVTTSKDSSIDSPGYLSALVYDITYVDDQGKVVTLQASNDHQSMQEFISSNGLMGVVVEATLHCR